VFGKMKSIKGVRKMKRFRTIIIICLAVLLAATLGRSVSFAGTAGPEHPPGAPPYGVAVQSKAAGTKLYGVITIEYRSIIQGCAGTPWAGGGIDCFNSRVFMQLNRGSVTGTIYKEGIVPANVPAQAVAIQDLVKKDILDKFFNRDYTLGITLVSLGNPRSPSCADLTCSTCETATSPCHDEYVMLDVVIAVK
jgi:hypothetical protein